MPNLFTPVTSAQPKLRSAQQELPSMRRNWGSQGHNPNIHLLLRGKVSKKLRQSQNLLNWQFLLWQQNWWTQPQTIKSILRSPMTLFSHVPPSDNQKDQMPTKAKNFCFIVNLGKGRVTKDGLISSTLFCLPCDLPCSTLLQSCNLPIPVQVHKICPWKRSKDVHCTSCRARYTCSDGCLKKLL